MVIGRYEFGVWPGFKWDWWSRHEYWDRLVIGPFYVLRGREADDEEVDV